MGAEKWTLEATIVELELAQRFAISGAAWDVARNVFVTVRFAGVAGVGEASPSERAGGSPEEVVEQLAATEVARLGDPFHLEGVLALLPPGPARCAVDVALHDLAGKLARLSVTRLLGVRTGPRPPTSVTLPIAPVDDMVERARSLADHPVLKMKVGFDGDVDAVAAVRRVYDGRLRIDANEGWSTDEAIARLEELEALDVELCEQPVPAGDRGALAAVTRATSIPVFADEDVHTAADVVALADVVDGVNLKLRKAGGIRATVHAIAAARACGLGVMIGCDLESGVAATAGAHVAALCDHADLDGPLLLANDPFPGVAYERGAMTVPDVPGLGVSGFPA